MKKTLNPFPGACIDPAMLLGESVVRMILSERKSIGFDGSSVIVQSTTRLNKTGSRQDDELLLQLTGSSAGLPKFRGDLNHPEAGFFKSMNRLKKVLFNLEHKYFTAEKLFSFAAVSGLMDYPVESLNAAMNEILLCQSYKTSGDTNTRAAEDIAINRIVQVTSIIDEMIATIILKLGNPIKEPSPSKGGDSFDTKSETSHKVTDLVFKTEKSKLVFNSKTGFPSVYEYDGDQLLSIENMNFTLFDENSDQVSAAFEGPLHISEYGPVRTIIESSFRCGNTQIHVRYLIPGEMPYFDISITVDRLEKDKIIRWEIPMGYNMNCIGRSLSGINCCKHRNREFVFRDWLGMKNFEGHNSLSLCADGAYSYNIAGNTVRITLLRGNDLPGNTSRFRLFPGNTGEVIDRSFNNSDLFNNPLITRSVFTEEDGKPFSGIRISDPFINLQSVRLNEAGKIVLRLLNPCKETKKFTLEVLYMNLSTEVEIGPKKLKTLVFEKTTGEFIETDLLERVKT